MLRPFALLAALLAAAPAAAAPADPARGQALYETACTGCHDESVHGRAARSATSFGAVRAFVWRWNRQLSGSWTQAEIDDVTVYLNRRYYGFPCPGSLCPTELAAAPRVR